LAIAAARAIFRGMSDRNGYLSHMRRVIACLALALVSLTPATAALAELANVDSAEHLAFIEGLPVARAVVQAEQADALAQGVTAEMHEANAALVGFLGESWLRLAAVWPADHFGTPSHAEYLDTFTVSRIGFYRAINTFEDDGMEGTLLGVIIGTRLVKDLDQFVADTATAQLSRHDPMLSLDWLAQWQEAAR
jgi:hypothetical protein